MTKEVIIRSAEKAVERVVKRDDDQVIGMVEGLIKKLFLGIDLGSMEKKIKDLQDREAAGALSAQDKEALPQLLKVFTQKRKDVGSRVESLVESVMEAGSLTEAEIKRRALDLIIEVGGSDVVNAPELDLLSNLAKDGLLAIKSIKETPGNRTSKRNAAKWLIKVRKEQFISKQDKFERGDNKIFEDAGKWAAQSANKQEATTLEELAREIESHQNQTPNKSLQELLTLDSAVANDLLVGSTDDIASDIGMLANNYDRGSIARLIEKAKNTKLDAKEKTFLHTAITRLSAVTNQLETHKWRKAIENVNGLDVAVRPHGRSEIRMAGVVVDRVGGDLASRIKRAFSWIDFDSSDVTRQQEILQSVGITLDQAKDILNNVAEWRAKYGDFALGVESIKSTAGRAIVKGEDIDFGEERDIGDVFGETEQMKWQQLIAGYDKKTGKAILTKEGEARREQLNAVGLEIDQDGRITRYNTFEEFGKEHLIDESRLAGDQQEALRRMRAEVEEGRRKMAPEDFVNNLKDRIEDKVMEIMRTGDASRAPGNQMVAYELYGLLGYLKGEGDYKDTWMARLALYDVKMFMSGVEGYEEFAKVASFLPEAYLAILQKDQIDIGMVIDETGAERQLKLNFADLLSMYEEQFPGSNDVRDIWIAKLLGSKNLTEFGLNKRRMMAAALGKQLDIQFEYANVNGKEVFRQIGGGMLRREGQEVSLLSLVGLSENGERLAEELRGEFDFADEYGWYTDMPMDWMHIHLRSVGLERGGNKGAWWPQLSNGLRKLHGAAQEDYHKNKKMSKKSAVDDVDSGWRSFLAWKLFAAVDERSEDMVFFQRVDAKLKEQGVSLSKKKKFYEVLKQIVYLPEKWENFGITGELRNVAEVRSLITGNPSEYTKVLGKFKAMDDGSDNFSVSFDWKNVLGEMGYIAVDGVNTKGEAGLKLLIENFNLQRLIDYEGLPHNFWADNIKYTGYASEFWKASVKYGDFPWDPGMQKQLGDIVGQYFGEDGRAWKARQVYTRQTRNAQMQWEGTETYMDEKGKETTVMWKIDPEDNSNKANNERADAARRGFRVGADGYVYDQNNQVQYRRGTIKFTDGLFDLFGNPAYGSAAARSGYRTISWKERKNLLKGYLKSSLFTPEQWRIENKRFKYAAYFGAEIPWQVDNPTLKDVLNYLREKPSRFLALPYTIMRGLWVDLGLEGEDVVNFFSPLGKEVGKQLHF